MGKLSKPRTHEGPRPNAGVLRDTAKTGNLRYTTGTRSTQRSGPDETFRAHSQSQEVCRDATKARRSSQARTSTLTAFLDNRTHTHITEVEERWSWKAKRRIAHGDGPGSANEVRKEDLTCALGPGGERRPWWPCAPFSRPCEQNPDLILHVGVQVPQLVVGRVNYVGLGPGASGGAVFHLLQDDGAVPDDGVGVGLDPQVCGPHSQQLWGCDGRGRL